MYKRIPREETKYPTPKGLLAHKTSPIVRYSLPEGARIMDLSDSIIMPREDFYELQASASTPVSMSDRIAGTVQTTVVFAAIAGAFVGASYGWAKAVDWLEQKRFDRDRKSEEPKSHLDSHI